MTRVTHSTTNGACGNADDASDSVMVMSGARANNADKSYVEAFVSTLCVIPCGCATYGSLTYDHSNLSALPKPKVTTVPSAPTPGVCVARAAVSFPC